MQFKFALTLCSLTLLTLSACGGGDAKTPKPQVTPTPTPAPAPTPTPAPTEGWVSGQVLLVWHSPTERENGDPLTIDEIGGYEVRYRKQGQADYTYILYEDNTVESHTFANLEGLYEFQVAVYDTNGLYSQFLKLTPYN